MVAAEGYEVTVTATETVAAAQPLQKHRLPLSNLDLLLPPLAVGVFFCYRRRPARGSAAEVLRAALAKVLVSYYPLAGEVVANAAGEPELLCNNRGVDFIVASATGTALQELSLGEPDESVEGKLVPEKKAGVLCVQVTEFKCGGVVVGCTFDHRVADAYSFNMFLVAWAATARASTTPPPPSFCRSLLSPRRPPPPLLDPLSVRLFVPLSSAPPPPAAAPAATNRIYRVTAADIAALQALAGAGRTKLEAFTAHLWQLHAKAAGAAAGLHQLSCCMGVVVDGRSRLHGAAMQNYFGNVLSIPFGVQDARALREMPLADVASDVHAWVAEAATAEHFRGLVDYVEALRPEQAVTKAYLPGEGAVACVVSSGRRFPVAEADFGWGQPAFASYHFPWASAAGYIMPMPSARGDGDWVVYVHVSPAVAAVMEEEPTVFKKLASGYVHGEED